jgi:hypothetical protein
MKNVEIPPLIPYSQIDRILFLSPLHLPINPIFTTKSVVI